MDMRKHIKRDALMLQISLGMDGVQMKGTSNMGAWVWNIALKPTINIQGNVM